jgi:hypothetical protein
MIDPEDVDSDGYLGRLADGDESRFRERYQEQYSELDLDAAKTAVQAELLNRHEPRHQVLEAVADGFHPYNEEGMATGYEVALSNPLYEIKPTAADLLLTAQDYREVHLCFVVCETTGEDYVRWAKQINEISDLYRGHEEELLEQVPVEGLDTGHIQFVTVARKEDLPDVDLKYLKSTVSPDNYAIWAVDDDYEGNSDRQVELRKEFGQLAHGQLRTVLEDGFDYGKGENTALACTLNSHEFVILREIFLLLMLRRYSNSREEPREFNKQDFEEMLVSKMQIGEPNKKKTQLVRSKAGDLLDIADDAEIVYSGESQNINTNRDYRLRFPSGMPTQVPEHIRPKYIAYRAPQKMARDAFTKTKEGFEPIDQLETELSDTESWGKEG